MNIPNEPSGTSSLAYYLKKIVRAMRASEVKPGIGYKVRRTSQGTILEIQPGGGGLASTVEVTICDADTGEAKTYVLYGYEKTTET